MQQHLAEGSVQSQATAQEAKALAQTMAERAESNQAKLALLDARLQEMDALNRQVEGIIAQATRTQGSNLLSDLESGLRLAQQQAQFTRNAQPLLDALEQAQTRLEQAADTAVLLKPASSAIVQDLARLKTANYPDVNAAVDEIDELMLALDALPLWVEAQAPDAAPAAAASIQAKSKAQAGKAKAKAQAAAAIDQPESTPAAWWGQAKLAGAHLWQETRSLVQIERADSANPAALNAQEAAMLREQIKLYALSARTSILAGRLPQAQQTLGQLQARLPRYFDPSSKAYSRVQQQLASVRNLLGASGNAAPQAQASIAAITLLNERLLAVPLAATLPQATLPKAAAAQKAQAGR
jgi:uroporphyrin-3 C-methyltransferase